MTQLALSLNVAARSNYYVSKNGELVFGRRGSSRRATTEVYLSIVYWVICDAPTSAPSPPKMTNVLVGSAADKNLIHVEPLNDSTINRIAMSQREYKC